MIYLVNKINIAAESKCILDLCSVAFPDPLK